MTEEQALALELLKEYYGDPIDAIGEPEINGDEITIKFQDEDRVFIATIDGEAISYYEIDENGNPIGGTGGEEE